MRAAIALLVICGACHSPQPQPDLTIRLHSGFIRGRVVEKETGTPLAHRRYRWIHDARPARTAALAGRIERLTTTDAQGRYRMQAPPAQPGIVSLWVEDDQGWRILWSTNYFYGAQPEDAEDRPEEVSARTRDIRLRVLDIDEQPIKGAEVRLVIRGEGGPVPDVAPFLTGADGTVATGAMEHGGYWADVSAPGYATARMCPYQYELGDKRFVDVILEKSIRISGRFLGGKERAPDGLQVAVGYVCKPKGSFYEWFVHVDKHGRFAADVPEGEEFQVQWTVSGQAHDTFRHYIATRSPDGRVVCRDTTDD